MRGKEDRKGGRKEKAGANLTIFFKHLPHPGAAPLSRTPCPIRCPLTNITYLVLRVVTVCLKNGDKSTETPAKTARGYREPQNHGVCRAQLSHVHSCSSFSRLISVSFPNLGGRKTCPLSTLPSEHRGSNLNGQSSRIEVPRVSRMYSGLGSDLPWHAGFIEWQSDGTLTEKESSWAT